MLCGYSTLAALAQEFGVSTTCIHKDMKRIREQWKEQTVRDFDGAQAVELRKLHALEAKYWAAWEESRAPKRTTKKLKTGEMEETTEYGPGNPRFLDGVLECVRSRCKLLGLDEADMIERARQRAAQQAQTNIQINIASITVVDALAMAERGEAIPQEVLAKMAPADLVQIHRKMIEGGS